MSEFLRNFGKYNVGRPECLNVNKRSEAEMRIAALARPPLIGMDNREDILSGCKNVIPNPIYNLRGGKESALTLEAQLQKMIDEELAGTNNNTYGSDPDESISKHMEASLRLWNKLTEVRNNYKVELKKKQEERLSFENDLRSATAQTQAEMAQIERELERVNKEICTTESQINDAENYKRKIEEETKLMEEELKAFAAEDESLQRELAEVNKAVQNAEDSIKMAEADFNRFKTDAEKEIAQAEAAYNKEIEIKDQQIAASTAELQQLESELSEFNRRNPQELEIQQFKEELQRLRMENDMIKAEIHQIQQNNVELRKNGEALLSAGEENLRKEQAANDAEEEKMTNEIKCLERKLQSVESHIHQLEHEKEQLEKQTSEVECQMEKMQYEIQTTKSQLKEKEQTMKEMCELIEKQEQLEQELEAKYAADMRQLERKANDRIRDIKNQMMTCSQKKQENMAKIRSICQEIKEAKDKLKDAETSTQETFRKLKVLTEEYDALKRQNERSEEFISFYDTIRAYETKYVELKEALCRAKEQRDYMKRDKERLRRTASSPDSELPKMRMRFSPPDGYSKHRSRRRTDDACKVDYNSRDHERNVDVGKYCGRNAAEVLRKTADPLSDPLIKAYLKANKSRNR